MGATAVDTTQTISSIKDVNGYDYVLVEDREKKRELPSWLKGLDRICNIPWLKQCLVSRSLPLAILGELMIDHGCPLEA
jgi:hypothetical protein